MFHSIRSRLIAGFTLLTLLTVSLLGILVLSLMQQYIARQETNYLQQNAVALARQSERYVTAPLPPPALSSLARTASLLGNFHVRILDADAQPLVDSIQATEERFTWVVTENGRTLPPGVNRQYEAALDQEEVAIYLLDPYLVNSPLLDPQAVEEMHEPTIMPNLPQADAMGVWMESPPGAALVEPPLPHLLRVFRRQRGEWGPLLRFEAATDNEFIVPPAMEAGELPHLAITTVVSTTNGAEGGAVQTVVLPNSPVPISSNRPMANLLRRFWPQLPRQQVTMPIGAENAVIGYVELSSTPGIATEALAALRRLFVLAAAGVSILAVGVGLFMSRSLTAPLQTLTAATTAMNSGDLTARANVHGNDEIGQLAHSFNHMAAALEQSFCDLAAERDALRHFVADASHELRTPITALRTFTDLLHEGRADGPTQAEFIAESAAQVKRLERMTENLLNLSRFDGGLVELVCQEFSVISVVEDVVELLRPLAAEQAIHLSVASISPTWLINGDRTQLERALTNLVENAIKFTPAHGQVQVGADRTDDQTTIWVKDSGAGIPVTEQADIFRRFYRGQHVQNEGSGLGLAIVQSIVSAHGGTVTVESIEGEGSRFAINLPIHSTSDT